MSWQRQCMADNSLAMSAIDAWKERRACSFPIGANSSANTRIDCSLLS